MLQLSLDFIGKQIERFRPARPPLPRRETQSVLAWKHGITVHLLARPRARRYLLRLQPDGAARLVIPRRGTRAEALRFLERSEAWLLKRHIQWRSRNTERQPWTDGARFLFRGEEVTLRVENQDGEIRLGFSDQVITLPQTQTDYRDDVLGHLRRAAERELPARTAVLARLHGITIKRVTVRAQKTRWGSCSARGTVSLNWRLVQAPTRVVDYLIIHELMHRREMNHSARFWKHVADAAPDYLESEKWLKSIRLEMLA